MKTSAGFDPKIAAGLGLFVLAAPAYFIAMGISRHEGPGFGFLGHPVLLLGTLGIAFVANVLCVVSLRFERAAPPQLQLSVAWRPWNLAPILLTLMLFAILMGYVFLENFATLGSRIQMPGVDMVFMPRFAPIVVLMFLGTCGAIAFAGLAALYGFIRKKRLVWQWAVVCALVIIAGYTGVLLVASLASSERVLARGQRKYFCEIDCHIAYSVEGVAIANTLAEIAIGGNAAYRIANSANANLSTNQVSRREIRDCARKNLVRRKHDLAAPWQRSAHA